MCWKSLFPTSPKRKGKKVSNQELNSTNLCMRCEYQMHKPTVQLCPSSKFLLQLNPSTAYCYSELLWLGDNLLFICGLFKSEPRSKMWSSSVENPSDYKGVWTLLFVLSFHVSVFLPSSDPAKFICFFFLPFLLTDFSCLSSFGSDRKKTQIHQSPILTPCTCI